MATIQQILRINSLADPSGIRTTVRELDGLKAKADETGHALDNAGNRGLGFGKMVGGIVAAQVAMQGLSAAVNFAKDAFINTNAQFETANIAFESLTGSVQKAQQLMLGLQQFANKTPFEMPGLLDASQKLLAVGFSAEQVIPVLRNFGNEAAKMGKISSANVNSIVYALSQMVSSGRLNAQDMMQLTNAGIQGWTLLARGMNKTVGEVRDMSEKGLIPAGQAVQTMLREMQKNMDETGDLMEKNSHGFQGAMSTIQDTMRNALANGFRPFFTDVTKMLDNLAQFLQGDMFKDFAVDAQTALQGLYQPFRDLFTGRFDEAKQGFKDLGENILATVIDIADMIASHLPAALSFFTNLAGEALEWGFNLMTSFATGMISGASGALTEAVNFVGSFIADFLKSFSPPRKGVLSEIDTWGANLLTTYFHGMTKADFKVLDTVGAAIKDALTIQFRAGAIEETALIPSVLAAQALVAQALDEVRVLGDATEETLIAISEAAGPAGDRIGDMVGTFIEMAKQQKVIDEITARMREQEEQIEATERELRDQKRTITEVQDAIEDVNRKWRDSERAAKRALDEAKEYWDDQLDGVEKVIRGLERQKRALEGTYDKDLSALEIEEKRLSIAKAEADLAEARAKSKGTLDDQLKIAGMALALEKDRIELSKATDPRIAQLNQQIALQEQQKDNLEDQRDAVLDPLEQKVRDITRAHEAELKPLQEQLETQQDIANEIQRRMDRQRDGLALTKDELDAAVAVNQAHQDRIDLSMEVLKHEKGVSDELDRQLGIYERLQREAEAAAKQAEAERKRQEAEAKRLEAERLRQEKEALRKQQTDFSLFQSEKLPSVEEATAQARRDISRSLDESMAGFRETLAQQFSAERIAGAISSRIAGAGQSLMRYFFGGIETSFDEEGNVVMQMVGSKFVAQVAKAFNLNESDVMERVEQARMIFETVGGALLRVGEIAVDAFRIIREAAGPVLGFLKDNWETVAIVVGAAGLAFLAMTKVVLPLVAVIMPLVAAVKAFLASVTLLGGVLPAVIALFNPVTLIIAGVVAAVVALALAWKTNFYGMRDIMSEVGAIIKDVAEIITRVIGGIIFVLTPVATWIKDHWSLIWNTARNVVDAALTPLFDQLGDVVRLIGNVVETVRDLLRGDWQGAWENAKEVALGFVEVLLQQWTLIPRIVVGALKALAPLVGEILGDIWQGLQEITPKILDWLTGPAWDAVSHFFTETLPAAIGDGLAFLGGKIAEYAPKVGSAILDALRAAGAFLAGKGGELAGALGGIIGDALGALGELAASGARKLGSAIMDGLREVPGLLKEGLLLAARGAGIAFAAAVLGIPLLLFKLGTLLYEVGEKAAAKFGEGLGRAGTWISSDDGPKSWPGKIGEYLGQILTDIADFGVKVAKAVADAFGRAWDWIAGDEGPQSWPVRIWDFHWAIVEGVERFGGFLLEKIGDAWGIAWKWITSEEGPQSWPGKIWEWWVKIVNDVEAWGRDMLDRQIRGWTNIWLWITGDEGPKSWPEKIWAFFGRIGGLIGERWDQYIMDPWRKAWNGMFDFLSNPNDGLPSWPEKIWNWLEGIIGKMETIGKRAVNALVGAFNGLAGFLAKPLDLAFDVLDAFIGGVNDVITKFGVPEIPKINWNPPGNILPLPFPGAARGEKITGRTIREVGEETPGYPEFIISTNPRDRNRSMAMLQEIADIFYGRTNRAIDTAPVTVPPHRNVRQMGGPWSNPFNALADVFEGIGGTLSDWVQAGAEKMISALVDKLNINWSEMGGGIMVDLAKGAFATIRKAATDNIQALFDKEKSKGIGPGTATISGDYAIPLPRGSYTITQGFGPASPDVQARHGYTRHEGIDLAAPAGTPIFATALGAVARAQQLSTGLGHHVALSHPGGISGSVYGHMSPGTMRVGGGQSVTQGMTIGGVGTTGNSSGNHLHFEMWQGGVPVNPANHIAFANGGWINEPIFGVGLRSRRTYSFGERGRERVIPATGGTGGPGGIGLPATVARGNSLPADPGPDASDAWEEANGVKYRWATPDLYWVKNTDGSFSQYHITDPSGPLYGMGAGNRTGAGSAGAGAGSRPTASDIVAGALTGLGSGSSTGTGAGGNIAVPVDVVKLGGNGISEEITSGFGGIAGLLQSVYTDELGTFTNYSGLIPGMESVIGDFEEFAKRLPGLSQEVKDAINRELLNMQASRNPASPNYNPVRGNAMFGVPNLPLTQQDILNQNPNLTQQQKDALAAAFQMGQSPAEIAALYDQLVAGVGWQHIPGGNPAAPTTPGGTSGAPGLPGSTPAQVLQSQLDALNMQASKSAKTIEDLNKQLENTNLSEEERLALQHQLEEAQTEYNALLAQGSTLTQQYSDLVNQSGPTIQAAADALATGATTLEKVTDVDLQASDKQDMAGDKQLAAAEVMAGAAEAVAEAIEDAPLGDRPIEEDEDEDDDDDEEGAQGIPGLWRGTNFAPGGVFKFGEQGPEIGLIPRGMTIVPAGPSRKIMNAFNTLGIPGFAGGRYGFQNLYSGGKGAVGSANGMNSQDDFTPSGAADQAVMTAVGRLIYGHANDDITYPEALQLFKGYLEEAATAYGVDVGGVMAIRGPQIDAMIRMAFPRMYREQPGPLTNPVRMGGEIAGSWMGATAHRGGLGWTGEQGTELGFLPGWRSVTKAMGGRMGSTSIRGYAGGYNLPRPSRLPTSILSSSAPIPVADAVAIGAATGAIVAQNNRGGGGYNDQSHHTYYMVPNAAEIQRKQRENYEQRRLQTLIRKRI